MTNEMYMNAVSGDVQSREDWIADCHAEFLAEVEMTAEEYIDATIEDGGLIAVMWDGKEWVEWQPK